MGVTNQTNRLSAESRFRAVFAHLGAVTAYARRRGSHDPDSIAAEAMAIAWRKLVDVPPDDPRPWLFATARNLLLAERRQHVPSTGTYSEALFPAEPAPELRALDPELLAALRSLTNVDREALFLIAWEDLSPSLAAKSLGISKAAFRVRLHRARRRLERQLASTDTRPSIHSLEVERP
jgi:RNA polymerase sigma-70 factor (ECF subfamily)